MEHGREYEEKENKINNGADIFNEIQEKYNEFLCYLF
jgi:hypothetical protein